MSLFGAFAEAAAWNEAGPPASNDAHVFLHGEVSANRTGDAIMSVDLTQSIVSNNTSTYDKDLNS